DGLPAAVCRRHRAAAVLAPRRVGRRLAPRMRELHAGQRALAAYERGDRRPGDLVRIRPDAGVARRDAALGRHGSRLAHHDARATARERAKVHEVPLVRDAVAVETRVLAHRRDPQPVAHRGRAQGDRVEQAGHQDSWPSETRKSRSCGASVKTCPVTPRAVAPSTLTALLSMNTMLVRSMPNSRAM